MATPRSETRAPQKAPAIKWRPRRSDEEVSGEDRFYIPPEVIPPGMAWEWKRYTALGLEDIEHQVALSHNGAWDPVPHDAWPDKLGQFGHNGEAIILGGQMLMQRPAIYNEEAKAEEHRKATSRVSNHMKSLALADGDGPLPKAKARIKTDYSTQLVPNDDDPE